ERRAVILADKGISDICPEETWAQTIAAMLEEFKKGRYFEGLEKSVHMCGEILKTKLPLDDRHKPNQLPNHLILKD
ncbi:MAG: hypothetical protein AB7N80_01435, partial [Bdellovibrionales bacterium]